MGVVLVVVSIVVVGADAVPVSGAGANVLGAMRLGNTSMVGTKRFLRMGCSSLM
jgi:hypothetical protein